MLMGGWSNSISVTAPRVCTWSRSSPTAPLPVEQPADGTFQRDARVGASVSGGCGEEVDGRDSTDHSRDRIGERRATEARRIVACGPTPVRLGAGPVPGPVARREG